MRKFRLLIAFAALTQLASAGHAAQPWEDAIAAALGKPGTEMPGGVYRVGLPRTDLNVVLDGVAVKATLALGSWVAFMRHGNDTMLMGDLVLTDEEVGPVMKRLLDGGVTITALHNHLLRATPHTMYMHVGGTGDGAKLAATLHAALALSQTPFPGSAAATTGAAAPPAPAALEIDTAAIDQALGHKGKVNNGVYAFSIPRAIVPRAGGVTIPEAMGSATAINFQPTGGGKAAIAGDLVLTANEVNPVLSSLRASGIDVTALHSHMLDDQPRLFFMHFWANDDAKKLALGLAAALKNVKIAK
jgi:uncharacterized protein DUF1259